MQVKMPPCEINYYVSDMNAQILLCFITFYDEFYCDLQIAVHDKVV